jgi:N-acetylated-alpha-linked acidic dipeptidase
MHRFTVSLLTLVLAGILTAPRAAEPQLVESASQGAQAERALEQRFDAQLSSQDQLGWLKLMAAEPNQVGSPHDKANADWELDQFRKFGWDAHIETYQVLYPTPISEAVEMLGPKPFKVTLQEAPIPGDTSATAKQYALPAYLVYQGDGDVTAPLVYVNYGTVADYKQLDLMGISVKGKIVITRYGQVWRGVKPLLAQMHGAIGCLIYSDPIDDGYALGAVYPKGPMRPPQGIQRGSVMDIGMYPGDPLTPGVPATANAKRLTRQEATSLIKIPALPISYGDAQVLLSAMSGPVVPANWRGALPITYRVGPGTQPVHLLVKSNWDLKPVYDVIATIKGSTWPDQWVVRGNHHDGWVEGASDPLSGQVALLDEAKAIGGLLKSGWRPQRTIVYTSWDGEEPMLLGSTEWAEDHDQELKQKAVLYINSDGNSRGFLHGEGNQDMGKFLTRVADSVTDPEAHVSVGQRSRADLLTRAMRPGASAPLRAEAKAVADPSANLPLGPLGSGSDYTAFIDHLGVTTLDIGFGGESPSGSYHSRYDTFEHHTRFIDPGLVYGKVLAEMAGHAVLDAADSSLPFQHPMDFAKAVAQYVSEVKTLADTQRTAAKQQQELLSNNAYAISADPTISHANPAPLKQVPKFDFSPLDSAVATLTERSKAYDTALTANGAKLSPSQVAKLQGLMGSIEQTLLAESGLPGRSWFKNVIYAPGRYIGYGATTLPGVTEAITDERWGDVSASIAFTADALNAYGARLAAATEVLNQS